MNIIKRLFGYCFIIIFLHSCNSPVSHENTHVLIKTTAGDITIKLYDGTPLHRDNFINLVRSGSYDNVSFHRVIKDFMIQTGDPATRSDLPKSISDSLASYTIPAEFNPSYFHKKGAVAAARTSNEENPDMRSTGTQFYIVQGVKFTDSQLSQAEQIINRNIKQGYFIKLLKQTADSLRQNNIMATDAEIQEMASIKMYEYLSAATNYIIPEDQRNVYKSIGGTPRLDGTYTVFGEVIEGLDVVDRIAATATDAKDKPINDIRILKMKIVKN
jgi:peptidylprolyl isomerase